MMSTSADSNPLIEARSLTKAFGDIQALQGLSLELHEHQIYGLVGPDGAGKTTAIRILAGLMKPDRGAALMLGRPMRGDRGQRRALGYMPQAYSLYGDLSVDENLSFFSRLFGLKRTVFLERRERLLDITRLDRFTARRASALSGGMYKKLALACALLHRPDVLLLDEPTNGVDPVSRRELWALLHEFAASGMAILISTPYMDEAERCSCVGLIAQGQLLSEGEPRTLISQFCHDTIVIHGIDRDDAELILAELPGILASSPAGEELRLVVEREALPEITRRFAAAGGRCQPARPTFEDLFLAQVSEGRCS